MLRQAGCIRVSTTYFESTPSSAAGSAASKRMVTMVSSTSSVITAMLPRWCRRLRRAAEGL
jgi:hypothetical protein